MWTWIKGSNTDNALGVYGTPGIAASANMPGARKSSVSWTDLAGNLWLFGGNGYDAGSTGKLNDLWKFDPISNQWTWMKGNNVINVAGTYGTQGISDATNNPGAREEAISWTDNFGNLWLFGGVGYTASGDELLSDLWKYNVSSNQWTWVKGDSITNAGAIYGSLGISAPTNNPGARHGAVSWKDATGNFWLFGSGYQNDLWKLTDASVLPLNLLNIYAAIVQNNVQVTWQTAQEINTSHFIIERGTNGRNFLAIGTQASAGNSSSLKNYLFIDKQFFAGTNYYRIKMVDKDGSFRYSAVVKVISEIGRDDISVFPNPVVNTAVMNVASTANAVLKLNLYDDKGRLVSVKQVAIVKGDNSFIVDMSKLSKGVYTAMITWGRESKGVRIAKQ